MTDEERAIRLLRRSIEKIEFVASQGGMAVHVDLLKLAAGDLGILESILPSIDGLSIRVEVPEKPELDDTVPVNAGMLRQVLHRLPEHEAEIRRTRDWLERAVRSEPAD